MNYFVFTLPLLSLIPQLLGAQLLAGVKPTIPGEEWGVLRLALELRI